MEFMLNDLEFMIQFGSNELKRMVELLQRNNLVIQEKFCPEDSKFLEEIVEKIKAKK
jgi:hypothetical protein